MTDPLPKRIPGADLIRWCEPPPDGWFGDNAPAWPPDDFDPDAVAVQRVHQCTILTDTELPDDPEHVLAVLERVRDKLVDLPPERPHDAGRTSSALPQQRPRRARTEADR